MVGGHLPHRVLVPLVDVRKQRRAIHSGAGDGFADSRRGRVAAHRGDVLRQLNHNGRELVDRQRADSSAEHRKAVRECVQHGGFRRRLDRRDYRTDNPKELELALDEPALQVESPPQGWTLGRDRLPPGGRPTTAFADIVW